MDLRKPALALLCAGLLASPAATVDVWSRTVPVTASTASPDERARLWQQAVQMYPGYAGYQAKTTREIPVVILAPQAN